MPGTDQLIENLLALPEAMRLRIAGILLASAPPPTHNPNQSEEDFIRERLAEYERNPDNVIPWEEVKATLIARLEECKKSS